MVTSVGVQATAILHAVRIDRICSLMSVENEEMSLAVCNLLQAIIDALSGEDKREHRGKEEALVLGRGHLTALVPPPPPVSDCAIPVRGGGVVLLLSFDYEMWQQYSLWPKGGSNTTVHPSLSTQRVALKKKLEGNGVYWIQSLLCWEESCGCRTLRTYLMSLYTGKWLQWQNFMLPLFYYNLETVMETSWRN